VQATLIIAKFIPHHLLKLIVSLEALFAIGRVNACEICKLHVDAVGISEAQGIWAVAVDWERLKDLT
jgi:hypothetical protein